MEIVPDRLWAAAATTAQRTTAANVSIGWTVWWAAFSDVLASGPSVAAGTWLRLAGGTGSADGHLLPHVHVGLPLYPAGHSLVVFAVAFGIATILAHRIVFEMLGWLMHILIDIPTHSLSHYATRFLWPLSDYRIDGVAWWTLGFGQLRTWPLRLSGSCYGRKVGSRLTGAVRVARSRLRAKPDNETVTCNSCFGLPLACAYSSTSGGILLAMNP